MKWNSSAYLLNEQQVQVKPCWKPSWNVHNDILHEKSLSAGEWIHLKMLHTSDQTILHVIFKKCQVAASCYERHHKLIPWPFNFCLIPHTLYFDMILEYDCCMLTGWACRPMYDVHRESTGNRVPTDAAWQGNFEAWASNTGSINSLTNPFAT